MNQKFSSMDNFFFTGLLLAIIFSSVTVFLVLQSLNETDFHSELFIKPQQYSNFAVNNEIYFSMGIINQEKEDYNYIVKYVADQELISSEEIMVKKNETIELQKTVKLDDKKRIFPFKFRIIISTPQGTENVFFWINGKKLS